MGDIDEQVRAGVIVTCPQSCGDLTWTVAAYGRVTHKHMCKRRAWPWCQTHADYCRPEFPPNPTEGTE